MWLESEGISMIAALYVARRGHYFGLPNVDPWDELRDARNYAGPYPVVAHPPCSRWCRLAKLIEHRWGHEVGDDGGCFAAALQAVRTWGGVLEHPAHTRAWPAFGLPRPPKSGWAETPCGGWVTEVEQGNYGHAARKATWLYVVGTKPPELLWGKAVAKAYVSFCANRSIDGMRRLTKKQAKSTPLPFRDLLISIAVACNKKEQA